MGEENKMERAEERMGLKKKQKCSRKEIKKGNRQAMVRGRWSRSN